MEKQGLEAIASRIVELVQATENQQITGVRLGVQIRDAFPTFAPSTYHCKNLRQFIVKNVPKLSLQDFVTALKGFGVYAELPEDSRFAVRLVGTPYNHRKPRPAVCVRAKEDEPGVRTVTRERKKYPSFP